MIQKKDTQPLSPTIRQSISFISKELARWYGQNSRDLPWRSTKDPYAIWLSEVIMQQTRVEQGTPYYLKFLKLFPDVHTLANASEDEVLKAWEGLGYYSRARNLRKAAQLVSTQFDGIFPADAAGLKELPGVGNYIAAAVSSICYGQEIPVVDGNVYRLLSRLFLIDTEINTTKSYKEFSLIAAHFLKGFSPGMMNQAIMEYGARVCTYRQAKCDDCLLQSRCGAFKNDLVSTLPVKKSKAPSTNRYFNYHVILHQSHTYIKQRPAGDVWQGLHEFIAYEEALADEPLIRIAQSSLVSVHDYKHILSHQNIFARFFVIRSLKQPKIEANWIKVALDKLDDYAFARLTTRFLEEVSLDA